MGGGGWWLEGRGDVVAGGRDVGAAGSRSTSALQNLTRTFERLNPGESCCLGLLHYKQPAPRRAGGDPRERDGE